MADYLESYAARFDLPVRTGLKVDDSPGWRSIRRCIRQPPFRSGTRGRRDGLQPSKVPPFADELHPSIVQLHSSQYRNPSQLQEGAVLVVVRATPERRSLSRCHAHPTFLSGKPSGELPVRHGPAMARFVFPVIRFVGNHVLTLRTPIGRKVQPSSSPMVRRSSA